MKFFSRMIALAAAGTMLASYFLPINANAMSLRRILANHPIFGYRIPAPIPYLSDQFYVRLTCQGITTPVGTDPVYTDLASYYFVTDPNAPYPSVSELHRRFPAVFDNITQRCNEQRYAKTNFGATGPTWENDRKYQRIAIDEVTYSGAACRSAGQGCFSDAYCCDQQTCDTMTHACRTK